MRGAVSRAIPRARMLGLLVLLAAVLLSGTASAATGGSKSIATATTVAYGQQEFGNTATGQHLENSCGFDTGGYRSYWALSVLAGDEITIDWESSAHATELLLMPVGTTDFTLFQVNPVVSQELSSNGQNQAQYQAPQAGAMPLYFRVCQYVDGIPGPYDFIATDQHALAAGLKPHAHVKPTTVLTGSADFADGTPAPDGLIFHLVAKWRTGRAVYRATSQAGALSLQLALPREAAGQMARFAITRGADANYQAVKSSPLKAKVARAHHRHHHR